jgi:Ca2+-binding EF-hand superfamily protein
MIFISLIISFCLAPRSQLKPTPLGQPKWLDSLLFKSSCPQYDTLKIIDNLIEIKRPKSIKYLKMPVYVQKVLSMDQVILEKKIRETLDKADTNENGGYTKEELKKALQDLGAYVPGWRAKHSLGKADVNKDGQISGEEIDTLVDHYLLTCDFGKN